MEDTRDSVLLALQEAGIDEWSREDAELIVDILLEGYDPLDVHTWLFMHDAELDGTPLLMIVDGRGREVVRHARSLVSSVCS